MKSFSGGIQERFPQEYGDESGRGRVYHVWVPEKEKRLTFSYSYKINFWTPMKDQGSGRSMYSNLSNELLTKS